MDVDTTQDDLRWHEVSPARGEGTVGIQGKEKRSLAGDWAGLCSRNGNLRLRMAHLVMAGRHGRPGRLEGREERREGPIVRTHVPTGTRRKRAPLGRALHVMSPL